MTPGQARVLFAKIAAVPCIDGTARALAEVGVKMIDAVPVVVELPPPGAEAALRFWRGIARSRRRGWSG